MARFIATPALFTSVFRDLFDIAVATGSDGAMLDTERLQITESNLMLITGAAVRAFHAAGGEVWDGPFYFKMSPETYALPVPEGMRWRLDPETKNPRTWSEWMAPGNSHIGANDGDIIVPGDSWGAYIEPSEIDILAPPTFTLLVDHEVAQFTS